MKSCYLSVEKLKGRIFKSEVKVFHFVDIPQGGKKLVFSLQLKSKTGKSETTVNIAIIIKRNILLLKFLSK